MIQRYLDFSSQEGDMVLCHVDEPASYKEVMEGPNLEKWIEAIQSKMDHVHNQVWTLVDPHK